MAIDPAISGGFLNTPPIISPVGANNMYFCGYYVQRLLYTDADGCAIYSSFSFKEIPVSLSKAACFA